MRYYQIFNYDTQEYEEMADLPTTKDGLLPYVPAPPYSYTDAPRELFKLYIDHRKMTPPDAYIKVLEKMVGVSKEGE